MNIAEYFAGKKILVFGLGRQGGGVGDANWLASHGFVVKATDQQSAAQLGLKPDSLQSDTLLSLGSHNPADIDWADLILKNPAVPDDHPLILQARAAGKPGITSIALYVKYASIPVIGVTGTRGKSTTTALIAALLKQAYPGQIITGGNIPGTSGLALFDQEKGKKYAVLELSSFQLHNFHDLHVSPGIAVITNLYPDHLNRYPDMDTYQHDKEAIVAYQNPSDVTLFNHDNPGALVISRISTGQTRSYSASSVDGWETPLPGLHNRENIAAMLGVGRTLGISESMCKQVVQSFHGLPFRQELVSTINNIGYINDTTATTPVAAIKAIQAQTSPFILICGGESKNLPYTELSELISKNDLVKGIVILGGRHLTDFVTRLKTHASPKILGQVDTMQAAVNLATRHAASGENVLLSPGFASFDLFQNEFDRGRQFNDYVKTL